MNFNAQVRPYSRFSPIKHTLTQTGPGRPLPPIVLPPVVRGVVAGGGLAGVVFLATEAGVLGASAGLLLAASLASSAFTCEETFQLHTKVVE